MWRLGALFLCVNGIYFSANAFLPIFLASRGHSDLISHALLALNLGQLPASLLLLAVAGRLERRAWPYIASGIVSLACIAGIVAMPGPATIFWAALLGFSRVIGWLDRYLVDGVLNAVSAWTLRAGDVVRRVQTGLAQDYVYGVALGILLLLIWAQWGTP